MIQLQGGAQAATGSAEAAVPVRLADFSAAVIQVAAVAVSAAAAARTEAINAIAEAYCFRNSTPCTPPQTPQKLVNISISPVDGVCGKITRMRSVGASNNSVNPHSLHP